MPLRAPSEASSPQRIDHSDISALTEQLLRSSDELVAMTEQIAQARQVLEYDSDLRKRALATAVREHLIAGESAAAAETYGRASIGYGEALDKLKAGYTAAEQVRAEHDAKLTHWKSIQSALSCLKTVAGNV